MYLLIYVWLIVCALSLVVEYFTQKAIAFWFAIGAFVSAILAGVSLAWYYQLGAFAVLTLCLTLVLRKPFLRSADNSYRSRVAFSAMGKQFELLTPITIKGAGTIKIDDGVFNVFSEDGSVLSEGELVQVVGYKEGKIFIKKVKKDV